MFVRSFNLSRSFNYTPYLFYKKTVQIRDQFFLTIDPGWRGLQACCCVLKLPAAALGNYAIFLSCIWIFLGWNKWGIRTRGCLTAARRTNHPELRSNLAELRLSLLSYDAPYWAKLHPTELRLTQTELDISRKITWYLRINVSPSLFNFCKGGGYFQQVNSSF